VYYRTAVTVPNEPQTPDIIIRESTRGKDDNWMYMIADLVETCKNNAILEAVMTPRLARTRSGFIAPVPAEARIGDDLYVLKDGKVVYNLRGEGEGEHHILIGERNVYGLLYGEIVGIFDEN
jgi:hypothetical protein